MNLSTSPQNCSASLLNWQARPELGQSRTKVDQIAKWLAKSIRKGQSPQDRPKSHARTGRDRTNLGTIAKYVSHAISSRFTDHLTCTQNLRIQIFHAAHQFTNSLRGSDAHSGDGVAMEHPGRSSQDVLCKTCLECRSDISIHYKFAPKMLRHCVSDLLH